MAQDGDRKFSEQKSAVRPEHDRDAPLADVGETLSYPSSLFGNPVLGTRGNAPAQISLMLSVQRTHGNRAARHLLGDSVPAPETSSSSISRAVQRFRERSAHEPSPVVARTGESTRTTSIQRQSVPDPAAEEASAIKDCQKFAPGWMKGMLKDMSGLDLQHLQKMQEVNDAGKVPGIDRARLGAAIDAVLTSKLPAVLKSTTLDWLEKNAENHSDQVSDIRDTVGLATFEPAFVRIVKTLGASIKAKRADYDTKMASTTVATDDKQNADPHTDNENRRKLTEAVYKSTEPLLKTLKEITKGRGDRYKCDDPAAEDAILATLQLETVFNAEATLAAPGTAREDSAKAVNQNKSLAWCGAFAAKSYLESEMVQKMTPGFPSTERMEGFFTYKPYTAMEPRWVFDQGDWKTIQDFHLNVRHAPRKWISDTEIFKTKGGGLDIRPGDIVLLDNNPNTRVEIEVTDPADPTKKTQKTVKPAEVPAGAKIIRTIPGEKADHIQMVQSWNPATHELFVIEGNSDGYIVDSDPAHPDPQGETPDQKTKRKEIEAATGQHLKPGTDASHVAVGMSDLANQPDPGALALSRKARVYGIGRLSIADFETYTYDTSIDKPKAPPKDKK